MISVYQITDYMIVILTNNLESILVKKNMKNYSNFMIMNVKAKIVNIKNLIEELPLNTKVVLSVN